MRKSSPEMPTYSPGTYSADLRALSRHAPDEAAKSGAIIRHDSSLPPSCARRECLAYTALPFRLGRASFFYSSALYLLSFRAIPAIISPRWHSPLAAQGCLEAAYAGIMRNTLPFRRRCAGLHLLAIRARRSFRHNFIISAISLLFHLLTFAICLIRFYLLHMLISDYNVYSRRRVFLYT